MKLLSQKKTVNIFNLPLSEVLVEIGKTPLHVLYFPLPGSENLSRNFDRIRIFITSDVPLDFGVGF